MLNKRAKPATHQIKYKLIAQKTIDIELINTRIFRIIIAQSA